MPVSQIAVDAISIQTGSSIGRQHIEKAKDTPKSGNPSNAHDKVEISDEGRARAEEMKAGKAAAKDGGSVGDNKDEESRPLKIKTRSRGEASGVDKEDAVDELKDTESDIRTKEGELQETKTAFFGSGEEQAEKIKELKQDIDDLKDAKKKLESKLSM
ncbi:hypothetical protein FVW20_01980 [Desulfovibrio oxamicus]|uniref:Uncharacterized protein n=1 Tax=Nitratidesulfovibrio oxamicus TaxID=32016 RepID=A0ABS0J0A6_9BACT|nr:hypothetical protein [Nitratidesulfovibrio oxamicus]MBG3875824.1 hypothetical protein [Nitratidesulfovibrio oxamicus]